MEGFAHLHVASGYSQRYGGSLPHDLVQRAAERGITTMALTDRDTTTGVVRFAKACAAAGVRPLFGIDLAVAPFAPPDVRHAAAPRCAAARSSPSRP